MGPPLILKAATSQIEAGLYTPAFADILAEHKALSAPVKARRPVRVRLEPPSDEWRHVAALGWLLLLSIGVALWYAIVDPVWRTPLIISSAETTSLHILPTSMPSSLLIESGTLFIDAGRAAAAADEWVFATIDPVISKIAGIGVETAVLSTPAKGAPSQATHRPVPDLIASFVETSPNAPTSNHRSPKDTRGRRPGNDREKPVTGRNGEVKGTIGNPFVDLYPEKPPSGLPSISTASRAVTGASQSEDPPSNRRTNDVPDAKDDVGSRADSQDPHPSDGAPGGSTQGKKDGKIDKPAPGGSASAEGKGPKTGKDKPSAGKSAPAGHQDNHHSNSGGPSPGKADQKGKSDADKKDKGKGGKDKGEKAKGPH